MSTTEVLPRRHRITVDDYYRMAEVGLLAPDARVELIHGEVMDMPPIGSLHSGTVARLNRLLTRAVGDRALVRCQLPLRLGIRSEPQPDFTIVKPRRDDYTLSHPTGDNTLLAIEVSDSTFSYDRYTKVPLYASQGIPEVWIVDLKRKRLFFFRSPGERSYSDVSTGGEMKRVLIAALPGVAVDLTELWTA